MINSSVSIIFVQIIRSPLGDGRGKVNEAFELIGTEIVIVVQPVR